MTERSGYIIKDMKNFPKYGFASFIAGIFMAFLVGWLFLIPAAFLAFLVYGLWVYRKDLKHRIVVKIKPTEVMKAIARREEELKREKERILYEEFRHKVKR